MRSISWPTAVVLCVAILVIGATLLAGPALGLEAETMHFALGSESVIGFVVLALTRKLLDKDAGDGGALVMLLAITVGAAITLGACSSGPQLPVTTTPMSISCTWNCGDGGTCEDCDCMIDRSSADSTAETTGNRARDVSVSPTLDTNVSAIPSP